MNKDKLREATREIAKTLETLGALKPGNAAGASAVMFTELFPLFPAPEPVDDKALAEAIARLDAGDTSCLLTDSVEVLTALRAAQQEVDDFKKQQSLPPRSQLRLRRGKGKISVRP